MKKLFIFIIVFSYSTTNAQWLRSFGASAGITISHQDWNYIHTLDYTPQDKVGLSIGAFAEFNGTSNFSIVTQLNYIQKGFEDQSVMRTVENPEGVRTVNWQRCLNYLNFTVLIKGRYNLNILVPYIICGPRLDFEVSNNDYIDGEKVVYDEREPRIADEYEKTLFGIKAGLGSEFELLSAAFFIEFVYDLDFTPLYSGEYLEIKTKCYNFNFGVSL